MLIDSHSHLQFSQFDKDRDAVIENSLKNGIKYIINVGTNYEDSVKSIEIAEKYDAVYSSAGIHPHDSEKMSSSDFSAIVELLNKKKVVAVGEIGLDYYRNYSPKEIQIKVFIKFLNLAEEKNVPVIIHNRDATEDIENILINETKGDLKGVVHCFSGDIDFADKILDMGLYISFTGNITYRNFKNTDLIKNIPIERILIETDCPYITPEPKRSQRNEPVNVCLVAEKIADIKGLPLEKVIKITYENTCRLFNIG